MSIAIKNGYMRINFPVTYDLLAAMEMVNKISWIYTRTDKKLNRLFDLSKNEKIDLNYMQMSSIIVKIKHMKGDFKHIKSAFLIENDIQFGFVRMFQTMVADLGTHVSIFFDEEDAVKWVSNGKTDHLSA